jgi:hypothetical protein
MSAPSKIVTEYFTQYHAEDSTPPPAKGLAVIAEKLDTMMESVIRDFSQIVKASPEHTARVQAIKGMQRCAGAYKQSKIIMKDVSEFEQMLAFEGLFK